LSGKKSVNILKRALFPDPFVPGIRSTLSLQRSEKADVSTRTVSKSWSCSAIEEANFFRSKNAKVDTGIMKFFYVYILQSESKAEHFYVGGTEDLHSRLKKHNAGEVPYTSTYRPWKIKTAIAFTDKEPAIKFERYLKTTSGRAFAKKRL
jgi:putative endonuclease